MVTVSGFAAVPSLSAAVASHFGMRSDVECFSLCGHGCPGGLVGVSLVQQLLLVRYRQHCGCGRMSCCTVHTYQWLRL